MSAKVMPDDFDTAAFLTQIDRNVELRGIRVVYYDGNQLHVVREGPPLCGPGLNALVIKPDVGATALQSSSAATARESKLYSEILGAALGCSAAVVGWIVVGGSAGAAPVTGGASTFITALAMGATLASSAQCLNSGVRIYNEISSPVTNDWLDSQDWYIYTANTLDAVSLAGAGAAAATTVRVALTLRRTTGKAMTEVLKGLSRQERKRLTEEVIRLQNPGISNGMVKVFIQAGKYPKRFTNLQVSNAVRIQLKDALTAALSFTGSAAGGLVSKGGGYVVGMAQSIETY